MYVYIEVAILNVGMYIQHIMKKKLRQRKVKHKPRS